MTRTMTIYIDELRAIKRGNPDPDLGTFIPIIAILNPFYLRDWFQKNMDIASKQIAIVSNKKDMLTFFNALMQEHLNSLDAPIWIVSPCEDVVNLTAKAFAEYFKLLIIEPGASQIIVSLY